MRTKLFFTAVVLVLCMVACEKKTSPKPSTSIDICMDSSSPYANPIWHPVKNIIGFNRIDNATYFPHPSNDSVGFWLVNGNGMGARRILPYNLYYPSWTANGTNLLFTDSDGIICSMPFDGENLEDDKIIRLGVSGYGAVMNQMETQVAYMGNDDSSNGTALYIYDVGSRVHECIGVADAIVGWSLGDDTLFYAIDNGIYAYDCLSRMSSLFYRFNEQFSDCFPILLSPNGKDMAFSSFYNDEVGRFLFHADENKNITRLTFDGYCTHFSYSADGQRLVYIQNLSEYQDEATTPTAWVVNVADGSRTPMIKIE